MHCVRADEVREAAARHADGGGPLRGGDGQEAGDGVADGNPQRHHSHLQDSTFDHHRESRQGSTLARAQMCNDSIGDEDGDDDDDDDVIVTG